MRMSPPSDTISPKSGPPLRRDYEPLSATNSDVNREPLSIEKQHDEVGCTRPLTTLSGQDLVEKIVFYLQNSMLDGMYGECLSGNRKRIYKPEWPIPFSRAQLGLTQPRPREEADDIFTRLYDPLKEWHLKPGDAGFSDDTSQWQKKIHSHILQYHEQKIRPSPPAENHYGMFMLYHNLPDAAAEGTIWANINLVNLALKREDTTLADQRITAALLAANRLDYKPLVAKCWYWRAMVAVQYGDHLSAAECLLEAMPCVGIYQEGALMSHWVSVYKMDMLGILDQQDAAEGETSWSRQCRRAILGIDPWFANLRPVARYSSDGEKASAAFDDVLQSSLLDQRGHAAAAERESHTADSLSSGCQSGRSVSDDDELYCNGKMDWTLLKEVEVSAEKSQPVSLELLQKLLKGFPPAYQQVSMLDYFVEGFDNYPDLDCSIAKNMLEFASRLQPQTSLPDSGDDPVPAPLFGAKSHSKALKAINDRHKDHTDDASPPVLTERPVIQDQSGPKLDEKISAYENALSCEQHIFHPSHLRCKPEQGGKAFPEEQQNSFKQTSTVPKGSDEIDRLRQENAFRIKWFRAEMANWHYQRKLAGWHQLPADRREAAPIPAKPDRTIEWLEANIDRNAGLSKQDGDSPRSTRISISDFKTISDLLAGANKLPDTVTVKQPSHSINSGPSPTASRASPTPAVTAANAISAALRRARLDQAHLSIGQLVKIADEACGDSPIFRKANEQQLQIQQQPTQQQGKNSAPAIGRRIRLPSPPPPPPAEYTSSEFDRASWYRSRHWPRGKRRSSSQHSGATDGADSRRGDILAAVDSLKKAMKQHRRRGSLTLLPKQGGLALTNQELRKQMAQEQADEYEDAEEESEASGEDLANGSSSNETTQDDLRRYDQAQDSYVRSSLSQPGRSEERPPSSYQGNHGISNLADELAGMLDMSGSSKYSSNYSSNASWGKKMDTNDDEEEEEDEADEEDDGAWEDVYEGGATF